MDGRDRIVVGFTTTYAISPLLICCGMGDVRILHYWSHMSVLMYHVMIK
jgi:hypothetical protein